MPCFNEKWQCKGVNYPLNWICLESIIHGYGPLRQDNIGNRCRLPFIYTLWLILNHLPQSKMLRPLGIKVFSLCIQTNSLLSLMDMDLGTSLGNPMYSRMCMIMLGLVWSLWLWKCLVTVVLLLCLMSKIWPWNLSMITNHNVVHVHIVHALAVVNNLIRSHHNIIMKTTVEFGGKLPVP